MAFAKKVLFGQKASSGTRVRGLFMVGKAGEFSESRRNYACAQECVFVGGGSWWHARIPAPHVCLPLANKGSWAFVLCVGPGAALATATLIPPTPIETSSLGKRSRLAFKNAKQLFPDEQFPFDLHYHYLLPVPVHATCNRKECTL